MGRYPSAYSSFRPQQTPQPNAAFLRRAILDEVCSSPALVARSVADYNHTRTCNISYSLSSGSSRNPFPVRLLTISVKTHLTTIFPCSLARPLCDLFLVPRSYLLEVQCPSSRLPSVCSRYGRGTPSATSGFEDCATLDKMYAQLHFLCILLQSDVLPTQPTMTAPCALSRTPSWSSSSA